MGEKLEDGRAAQPGALHGQTHLPPGHEPLWRHGEPAVCAHTHTHRHALLYGETYQGSFKPLER